jgi:hypothetical protein
MNHDGTLTLESLRPLIAEMLGEEGCEDLVAMWLKASLDAGEIDLLVTAFGLMLGKQRASTSTALTIAAGLTPTPAGVAIRHLVLAVQAAQAARRTRSSSETSRQLFHEAVSALSQQLQVATSPSQS